MLRGFPMRRLSAPTRFTGARPRVRGRRVSVAALPLLGLAGLAAVVVAGDVHRDVPPLTIDRPQAIAAAESALKDRGVALGPEWRRSAATRLVGDDGSGSALAQVRMA